MTELEAKLLEALKSGVFDGFRIDYPGGYSSKRKSDDKGVFIKDGEIVEFTDITTKFFNGEETERTTERKTYIPETDESILELLRKVGYKAYDHEELRRYSKEAYDERDRLRAEAAAKEAERLAQKIVEKHMAREAEEEPDDSDSVDRDEPVDDAIDDEGIDYSGYGSDDESDERRGLNTNEALGIAAAVVLLASAAYYLGPKAIKYWRANISPRIEDVKYKHLRPCPSCGKTIRKDRYDVWKCRKCGFSILDSELEQTVFWFCDGCGTFLNVQPGFSDDKERWTCTECGFENDITQDNILKTENL